MLQIYEDIKSRIGKAPAWYDEEGVPRYCEFDPDRVNNIYAKEVILLLIECQNCCEKFKVAMSNGTMVIHKVGKFKDWDYIHYGDPPRHSDHLGGTMNCIDLKILQYWEQNKSGGWDRKKEHEIRLEDL